MLIDVALVIGILLVALQAADFLFLPGQKARIQEFFDDFTLWMDDLNPGDLEARLNEEGVQRLVLLSSWLTISLAFLAFKLLGPLTDFVSLGVLLRPEHVTSEVIRGAIVDAIVLFVVFVFWRWPLRPLVNWIAHTKSPAQAGRRGEVVCLASIGLGLAVLFFGEPWLFPFEATDFSIGYFARPYTWGLVVVAAFMTAGFT